MEFKNYFLLVLGVITILLSWCSNNIKIETTFYKLPERKLSFSYPSWYNVEKDPYNKWVWSVRISKLSGDENGTIYEFQRWICFTQDAWTWNEETIDEQKFFRKPETAWEFYYYYENYPDTRTCISFLIKSDDKKEKKLFDNMIHSIKFDK